jgi:hypothetical protein
MLRLIVLRGARDLTSVSDVIDRKVANAFKHRNFRAIELVLPLRYTGSRPLAGEMGRSGAI